MIDPPFTIALANFFAWLPGQRGLSAYLVFVLAGGVFGASVVVLDACSATFGGRSFLGLTHGWKTTPKAAIVWFVGSLIAAGLGMAARVFEPTPFAALLAAASWRTILGKFLAMAKHSGQRDDRRNGG